jgi:hypothetical protein
MLRSKRDSLALETAPHNELRVRGTRLQVLAMPALPISIETPGTDIILRPATSSSIFGSARNARTMRAPKLPAPPTTTMRILGSPLSSIQKQPGDLFRRSSVMASSLDFHGLPLSFVTSPFQSFAHDLGHSHSMVAGGFPEMSYTTREMPGTSLTIRRDTSSRKSYGRRAQCAVMKSIVSTARSAMT